MAVAVEMQEIMSLVMVALVGEPVVVLVILVVLQHKEIVAVELDMVMMGEVILDKMFLEEEVAVQVQLVKILKFLPQEQEEMAMRIQ